MGLEVSRDSRGAGGCIACRAVSVSTGGARNPVGAGAVEPSERVTAATVGTVGAPVAAGCGAGGATKVARFSPPRGLRRWNVLGLL